MNCKSAMERMIAFLREIQSNFWRSVVSSCPDLVTSNPFVIYCAAFGSFVSVLNLVSKRMHALYFAE